MRPLRRLLPYLGIFLLALGLRLWMPGPVDATWDESLWLMRSQQFSSAVAHQDFSKATVWGAVRTPTPPTMPGVTMMWAGTAGRALTRAGSHLGLNQPLTDDPTASEALLRWSRATVALSVSVGLVLLAWAATRLVGRTAGLVAGVLCALEPWFVGLSFLLHTDALVATFGVASVVALAAAFRPVAVTGGRLLARWRARGLDPVMLGLSGVSASIALLTKLNAFALVFPAAAVIVGREVWRCSREDGPGSRWAAARVRLWWAAAWLGVVVAGCVVFWPAIWVDPARVVHHLWQSLDQPGAGNPQFFLGRATTHPGPLFYPVTLAFRLSPWLLLGGMVVVVLGVAKAIGTLRRSNGWTARLPAFPWVLLVAVVSYMIAISRYPRHYDRYGLPLVVVLAVFVSVLVAWAAATVRRWWSHRSRVPLVRIVAVLMVASMAGYVTSEAPNAISHVDPMLGGQRTAQHVMLLGWGQGRSHLGQVIAEREAGHCDRVRVGGWGLTRTLITCGRPTGLDELRPGDYLILNIQFRQVGIGPSAIERKLSRTLRKVASTRIHGVDYDVLYQVTSEAASG